MPSKHISITSLLPKLSPRSCVRNEDPPVIEVGGESDVCAVVAWCRAHSCPFTVTSGAPLVVPQAGTLVVSMHRMRHIDMRKDSTVTVEAGCRVRDVDWETNLCQRMVPLGGNAASGVVPTTLTGGWGRTSRLHGLSIDNVVAIRGVLATGEAVTASESENTELFWASRGAGSNFLAVTSLTFKTVALPKVSTASVSTDCPTALAALLAEGLAIASAAPNSVVVTMLAGSFNNAVLPAVKVTLTHFADTLASDGRPSQPEAKQLFDRLEAFAHSGNVPNASVEGFAEVSYAQLQTTIDDVLTRADKYFWHTGMVHAAPDLLGVLAESFCDGLPCGLLVKLTQMGGKINDLSPDETAWCNRSTHFAFEVVQPWSRDEDARDQHVVWTAKLFQKCRPVVHAHSGFYSNFVGALADEQTGTCSGWGANSTRLQRLKAQYDPENLFKGCLCIPPCA